ncbi:MAG: protein-methionine-sulfoxide reductase catalytic subunit MsrP [Rhodocyclaceae bacterium]|jgi:sulfoxide reductase catalytic subunit YedY|nr:protein-methionine-sulfoxide reductase catalytic subunit MsrP [Rhodocyclaceae bacterium]
MLIKRPDDCPSSSITPRELFERRRDFIKTGAGLALAALLPTAQAAEKLAGRPSLYSSDETQTPYKHVTGYNNFYEFGTDKEDPAANAHRLQTQPWTLRIEGLVQKPKTFDIDQLRKLAPLEERIYRLRCVEGWSMVIPWVGYPLAALLRQVEPLGSAKYVEFISAVQAENMPGVRDRVLGWPYVEGLRLDEARHPLTLLALGLYGEVLPKQNGAPIRIVVPWKYGFKSGKSIVRIRFTDTEPLTSWVEANRREYGFYSNVNPQVDHPRWSQKRERRLGEFGKRDTQLFNGYSEVAPLYAGMDLKRSF